MQQLEDESVASTTRAAELQAALHAAQVKIAAATAAAATAASAAAAVCSVPSVENSENVITSLQDENEELQQQMADLQAHYDLQVN